jgi:hypothetical protein
VFDARGYLGPIGWLSLSFKAMPPRNAGARQTNQSAFVLINDVILPA